MGLSELLLCRVCNSLDDPVQILQPHKRPQLQKSLRPFSQLREQAVCILWCTHCRLLTPHTASFYLPPRTLAGLLRFPPHLDLGTQEGRYAEIDGDFDLADHRHDCRLPLFRGCGPRFFRPIPSISSSSKQCLIIQEAEDRAAEVSPSSL
ncbi:hypothetical protein KFK09_014021 [Dendrobium nobile]|uniref:Uncharacterized protein n=1 Tax=Dendrobium nobile TaxID=94219 RepID=A0A8T3B8T2_DENNO|nr:hypothetical protein KFK09_014021 [Dendrobium nobile]